MATFVSAPVHTPFVQTQYVHTASPALVHQPLATPSYVHTASPAVVHQPLATPSYAQHVLATPSIGTPTAMPAYYVPNGYQRPRSHSMSYVHSPAPAQRPQLYSPAPAQQSQVYYSYGQSQYPQAGAAQPVYTTVHTSSTPYHDGYSRSRRASTSHSYHHGSPSHHRSHSSSHGHNSSHRRSHSTSRSHSHSRHHSQPQVIVSTPSHSTHHISQPAYQQHRRYSSVGGPGLGDRLRHLFGMPPSHRAYYIDARTGQSVDYKGRPVYHM
ncbi:uncharacterized protein C8Q71DRAFT_719680 [Rhodofomes roseus]|uniref:Uncharacterized protein n=1 Tax=Rhodofomes roseus TaxID=34475 RepID=A0ABQ8KXP3_9APHY|nr:uncharacterized protein C8Q71DRAFT_719680 [Rhodofomes roseus]KAH9844069.1 hypothetical protein C8Q71DRAFT_719680 [Rhodofomes roseus]